MFNFICSPFPTIFSLFDLFPKSFHARFIAQECK
jgi:hypothetical protein